MLKQWSFNALIPKGIRLVYGFFSYSGKYNKSFPEALTSALGQSSLTDIGPAT